MGIIAATAIAAIIGIAVLCLIARDISREVQGDKGQGTKDKAE